MPLLRSRSPSYTTSDDSKIRGYLGSWFSTTVGMIDILLAIQILVLNTIVIAYYSKLIKRMVPFMYVLLSITDSVTGIAAFLNGTMFLLFESRKPGHPLPGMNLIAPTYIIFSVTFRVSVFINLVVSVVRTINVLYPFYEVRKRWVGLSVIIGTLISVTLTVLLLVIWSEFNLLEASGTNLEHLIYRPSGYQIFYHDNLTHDEEFRNILIFIGIPFIIPSILAVVCMAIQIHAVLRRNPGRTCQSKHQREITKTILMLTTLFFFCNTVYGLYPIMYYEKNLRGEHGNNGLALGLTEIEQFRLQYCLGVLFPYINAAFNPAILMFRGHEIRRKVVLTVRGFLGRGEDLMFRPSLVLSNMSYNREAGNTTRMTRL